MNAIRAALQNTPRQDLSDEADWSVLKKWQRFFFHPCIPFTHVDVGEWGLLVPDIQSYASHWKPYRNGMVSSNRTPIIIIKYFTFKMLNLLSLFHLTNWLLYKITLRYFYGVCFCSHFADTLNVLSFCKGSFLNHFSFNAFLMVLIKQFWFNNTHCRTELTSTSQGVSSTMEKLVY